MIHELKIYKCDTTPTDEDIQQAVEIAQQNNCFVKLYWFVKDSEICDVVANKYSTIESVRTQIPQVYRI